MEPAEPEAPVGAEPYIKLGFNPASFSKKQRHIQYKIQYQVQYKVHL